MSNALHDYAKLFEKYAANNGGTGAILAGKDCLSLANEMRMDADAIDAENAKLRRAFNETLIRLVAANNVAVSSYMDDEYLELMCELGIEVDG